MSTLKVNNLQVGQDSTATNNLTWFQPGSPDGTIRLGSGNAGSATSKFTFDKDGNLTCVGTLTATTFVGNFTGEVPDWITHDGDTNTKIGFPANDQFQIHTGGASRLTVTDSTVELYSGSSKKLHTFANGVTVTGNLYATDTVYVDDTSDNGSSKYIGAGAGKDIRLFHTGSENHLKGTGDHPTIFSTNGTEKLRIASDGDVTITSTDAGALGPTLKILHNSASPAANDVVSRIGMWGDDSAGNETEYSRIETIIEDPTNGQETAYINFGTRGYSSFNSILRLKNRGTASAPSYTTDDHNGIILDTYNTGNPYPRYFNFIAKSAGNTDSNIGFWTEAVGGSPTEKLRITAGGHIIAGGQGNQIAFNNAGNDAFGCVLEIDGSHTTDHHGMLSIVGKTDTDGNTAGKIQFINSQNSAGSSGSNAGSKLVAAIEGRITTGDSNAGDDSGGYLRFVTKAEAGSNAESMRITALGQVGINNATPSAMLDIGGAYNKHGLRITSGASGYSDPFIVRRSTGGDTFRVSGNGAIVSESSMFTHYNHLVCQGGSGGNAIKNYILVCKTNTNDARLSGHFVITRQAGASGIAISKIEANLCGNNSAGDFRYQTRSMSTRGSYPGMEGRWVTLTYGGNNYYAIRLDPATDSSRWASYPQHCYFTGTENNCVGNGLGTIIDDNANTISSITELDDIQGTTVVRNSYNYIKEGYLSVHGANGQAAMQVIPYEMNVNNGSQPTTLTVKAQKNTALDLNRMYSHGTILQFRHNNDAVGYFSVNGSSSSHVASGSDIRLKKDIEDWTEEVLPYFKSLKPQKFRFNIEDETVEKTKGYMAQDNLDKFPEAYPLNPDDDRYWFAPSNMVPYLMKALQEEIIKREEIEEKYNALESRISALESSS